MTLTLTTEDQRRLQRATQTLVSPLRHATLDDWRERCCTTVRDLMYGDMAAFLIAVPGETQIYSPGVDAGVLSAHPDWARESCSELGLKDPAAWELELGVWSRRRYWGRQLESYYRTAYYNEWIVSIRCFDAVGMAGGGSRRGGNATMLCHHERPNGRKFGTRGLQLLELLRPAFEAGVFGFRSFHARREELLRTIDLLHEAVLLIGDANTILHQNPTATKLLRREPDSARLLAAVDEVLMSVRTRSGQRGVNFLTAGHPSSLRVHGHHETYLVTANRLDVGGMANEATTLVCIVPQTQRLPSEDSLRERYGLTGQQARVALQLAQRRTNTEIATALLVSPHTARHHTERVLAKLGVHSRSDVRRVLLELDE